METGHLVRRNGNRWLQAQVLCFQYTQWWCGPLALTRLVVHCSHHCIGPCSKFTLCVYNKCMCVCCGVCVIEGTIIMHCYNKYNVFLQFDWTFEHSHSSMTCSTFISSYQHHDMKVTYVFWNIATCAVTTCMQKYTLVHVLLTSRKHYYVY